MRNFWIRMNMRWSRDELSGWSSLQKTAYLLWPLLIYFIIHDVTEILLWAVVNIIFMGKENTTAFLQSNAANFRGVINGLAMLLGVMAIRQAVKREIAGDKNGNKIDNISGFVTRCFVVVVIAFLAAIGLNLLMNLLGLSGISKSYEDTSKAQYSVNFIIGLILYGTLSPLAEEAVFRGMIYNRMKRCFNRPVALCISALLFGCYHGNAVQAVYGTILGILIAWCYDKCGSFVIPVLFHSVANLSMYIITYYGGLRNVSGTMSVVVIVVSTLGAAGFLLYLQKINGIIGK